MRAQIGRWGNSLALRIPGHVAREIAVREGNAVDISVHSGRLIVEPVADLPAYNLDALIAAITDENLHGELDTGEPVGNESC